MVRLEQNRIGNKTIHEMVGVVLYKGEVERE